MESERRQRVGGAGESQGHANRPAIPTDVARAVLFEAGHRCTVCGAECPLERAHIIPWRNCKEHKVENLVCLCANCHARADAEKWSVETLLSYKKMPWVLRQRQNQVPEVKEKSRIVVTAKMELSEFDEKHQRFLKFALASFLEISPDEVNIMKIEPGSVKITMEVPIESIKKFRDRGYLASAIKMLQGVLVERIDVLDELGDIASTATMATEAAELAETEEQILSRLWSEVLGVQPKKNANFFDAGGNSLLVVRLRAGIAREFGVDFPLVELFRLPTVQSQAEYIKEILRERVGRTSSEGSLTLSAGSTSPLSQTKGKRNRGETPNPGAATDGRRRR